MLKVFVFLTRKLNMKYRLDNDAEKVIRTWYSLLNPVFSFADIFEICAMMFLTEIFLFVGGPLLVFSGKAYVELALSSALSSFGLGSVLKSWEKVY